jgi:DNA-binding NtrC family response regulator
MVGRSPAMQAVFDNARRFAPHLRSALLLGEAGTGRQSLARVLHALSSRGERPFVVVDCAMGDPAALEAHAFGAVDSSGAGTTTSRPGLADLADSGVLYFDEVTRLTAGAQSRLLRMIEHDEVLPVGGLAPHRIDVVVLAGATSDPRTQAQAGRFRHDLLYRLAVVEFRLPPLRERREDIPYLVAVFVRDAAVRLDKPLTGLAPEAEALLLSAPWHGNVRELQAAVERACLMSDGPVVSARDVASAVPAVAGPDPSLQDDATGDGRPLSTVERDHIVRALHRAGGNKKAAARMLGVSRRALYRKLERLDLATTISRRRRGGDDGPRGAGQADFDGVPSPARAASAAR